MIDKNPYEKDDVDVPNFGEPQERQNDPIFNMDTTSISPETDSFNIEEEAESSSKTAIIVMIAFIVLFFVGSITGWLFGISKSNALKAKEDEFASYKIKADNQYASLQEELNNTIEQLEELKTQQAVSTEPGETGGTTASGEGTKVEAGTYYLMEEGVTVRTGAGTSNPVVDYNKLPVDIQNIVFYDKEQKKVTTRNAKFPVYETKTDSNQKVWGKIADNAWVSLEFGKKQ